MNKKSKVQPGTPQALVSLNEIHAKALVRLKKRPPPTNALNTLPPNLIYKGVKHTLKILNQVLILKAVVAFFIFFIPPLEHRIRHIVSFIYGSKELPIPKKNLTFSERWKKKLRHRFAWTKVFLLPLMRCSPFIKNKIQKLLFPPAPLPLINKEKNTSSVIPSNSNEYWIPDITDCPEEVVQMYTKIMDRMN